MRRFIDKEIVRHGGRRARIVECINFDDPADLKAQGYRYIVRHLKTRQDWSVPEWALKRDQVQK